MIVLLIHVLDFEFLVETRVVNEPLELDKATLVTRADLVQLLAMILVGALQTYLAANLGLVEPHRRVQATAVVTVQT